MNMSGDVRYNGYNGSPNLRRISRPPLPAEQFTEEGQGYLPSPPHSRSHQTSGGPTDRGDDTHALVMTCIDSLITQNNIIKSDIKRLQEGRADAMKQMHTKMQTKMHLLSIKLEEQRKESQVQIDTLKHRLNVIIHGEGSKANPQLEHWLQHTCTLPQYLALFLKNGFNDMQFVCRMTEHDLMDIGIDDSAHRTQILTQITQYNGEQNKARPMLNHSKSNEVQEGSAQPIEMKENKRPIPKISFKQIPLALRRGCTEGKVYGYNELQCKIMDDLYTNACNLIISPAGSGKTVAVILSLIYKLDRVSLVQHEGSVHCLLIAVDEIHVLLIKNLCDTLVQYMSDINVIGLAKGSPPHVLQSISKSKGKNMIICSLRKALSLFGKGGADIRAHLSNISVFDGDTLCVNPLFLRKTHKIFENMAPASSTSTIDITVVSNSCCAEMEHNARLLFGNTASIAIHKYDNDYGNLRCWNTFCNEKDRIGSLLDICEYNPFENGLIYCSGKHEAKIVSKRLASHGYNCRTLENNKSIDEGMDVIDKFNQGDVDYIILYTYSPICLLQNIAADKLRIIIHYQIKPLSDYLKRCCVGQYSAAEKIHCISFDHGEEIQKQCNVKMDELPDDMQLLLDDAWDEYDDYAWDEEQQHVQVESQLMRCINEYLTNPVNDSMFGVLQLKSVDIHLWAVAIQSQLQALDTLQMEDLIDLIVDLFRNKEYTMLDNNEDRFYEIVFDKLISDVDACEKEYPNYLKHMAHLIAHLCLHVCVEVVPCYSFFIDNYRKGSKESGRVQAKTINKFISCSVAELAKNHASSSMLYHVKKFEAK